VALVLGRFAVLGALVLAATAGAVAPGAPPAAAPSPAPRAAAPAGSGAQAGRHGAGRHGAAVARVNGRAVPAGLFALLADNGRQALGLADRADPARVQALEEGVLAELVDRMLLAAEAERRGLRVQPAALARAEARAVAQAGGPEAYEAPFRAHGLTREAGRELLRLELAADLLVQQVRARLVVTEAELQAAWRARREDPALQRPETVTAAHVLVAARPTLVRQELAAARGLSGAALERALADELELRRARAEALRAEVLEPGADFAAVARRASEDPGTRAQGGELGTFERRSHPPAFDAAAFALGPGQVGPVVQTEFGFHVLRVSAHDAARALTFEEARPLLERWVRGPREAAALRTLLATARARARVEPRAPLRWQPSPLPGAP
jgi:parvulin-like peptidyl-prolyl isomerase